MLNKKRIRISQNRFNKEAIETVVNLVEKFRLFVWREREKDEESFLEKSNAHILSDFSKELLYHPRHHTLLLAELVFYKENENYFHMLEDKDILYLDSIVVNEEDNPSMLSVSTKFTGKLFLDGHLHSKTDKYNIFITKEPSGFYLNYIEKNFRHKNTKVLGLVTSRDFLFTASNSFHISHTSESLPIVYNLLRETPCDVKELYYEKTLPVILKAVEKSSCDYVVMTYERNPVVSRKEFDAIVKYMQENLPVPCMVVPYGEVTKHSCFYCSDYVFLNSKDTTICTCGVVSTYHGNVACQLTKQRLVH